MQLDHAFLCRLHLLLEASAPACIVFVENLRHTFICSLPLGLKDPETLLWILDLVKQQSWYDTYWGGGGEKTMWAQHGGLPGQGVIGVRSSQSMGKGLSL